MKVLHVTPAFYPATYWGGPIVSVFAACNALARQDAVELRVLTTDAAGPRRSDRVAWQDTPVYYEAGEMGRRRASDRDIFLPDAAYAGRLPEPGPSNRLVAEGRPAGHGAVVRRTKTACESGV